MTWELFQLFENSTWYSKTIIYCFFFSFFFIFTLKHRTFKVYFLFLVEVIYKIKYILN